MSTISAVLDVVDTDDLLNALARRGIWRSPAGLTLGPQTSVADTIDAIRRVSGWSETRLATEIGVTKQALYLWRRGTVPNKTSRAALQKILSLLGIEVVRTASGKLR